MPAPSWPAALPKGMLDDGFTEASAEARLKTPMEAGPPKYRRRSNAPIPISGAMGMTLAETDQLKEFVSTTLKGGSLPFTFPNQSGGWASDGTPLGDDWLVQFGDALPTYSRLGGDRWRVNLTLQVMP